MNCNCANIECLKCYPQIINLGPRVVRDYTVPYNKAHEKFDSEQNTVDKYARCYSIPIKAKQKDSESCSIHEPMEDVDIWE